MTLPNQTSRTPRWLGWIAYGVFVAGVALLGCEIVLRFIYQEPWYERLLDEQRRGGAVGRRESVYGVRDRNYPEEKSPSARRVLILGDSFTFGSGVGDDSKIFAEIIERDLSNNSGIPLVEDVEVLNGGIPGSYPAHWLELFDKVVDEFRPDLVVSVFFLRDGASNINSIGSFFGPIRRLVAERNAESMLYQYSYVYRVFRDARDRRLVARRYTRQLTLAYFGDEAQTRHWGVQQDRLREIFAKSRERGIALGFVVFPVLAELERDPYPFERINRLLVRFARRNNVPVLDLLDAFRGMYGPDLWVSPYDQHPNERGHAVAAEALIPFVRELLTDAEPPRDAR
jgi:lysophospholipase L1-like esterase